MQCYSTLYQSIQYCILLFSLLHSKNKETNETSTWKLWFFSVEINSSFSSFNVSVWLSKYIPISKKSSLHLSLIYTLLINYTYALRHTWHTIADAGDTSAHDEMGFEDFFDIGMYLLSLIDTLKLENEELISRLKNHNFYVLVWFISLFLECKREKSRTQYCIDWYSVE